MLRFVITTAFMLAFSAIAQAQTPRSEWLILSPKGLNSIDKNPPGFNVYDLRWPVLPPTPKEAPEVVAEPPRDLPPLVRAAIENLPPLVRAVFEEQAHNACNNVIDLDRDFITRRDINDDGIHDFNLNYGHVTCEDRKSNFCGSGGCLIQVFASCPGEPKGRFLFACRGSKQQEYVEVMNHNAYAVHFAQLNGVPVMIKYVHGIYCGLSGAEGPCRADSYWDGTNFGPAYPTRRDAARRAKPKAKSSASPRERSFGPR